MYDVDAACNGDGVVDGDDVCDVGYVDNVRHAVDVDYCAKLTCVMMMMSAICVTLTMSALLLVLVILRCW